MHKAVPITIMAAVGIGAGIALYLVIKQPSTESDPPQQAEAKEFDPDEFLQHFDLDKDGRVSWQEFKAGYGEAGYLFGQRGNAAMAAETAFKGLDTNGDGVIGKAELKVMSDARWQRFQRETAAKGLVPRDWKGRFLALNRHSVEVLDKELGARARKELPVGGHMFQQRYILGEDGRARWCRIEPPQGVPFFGFVTSTRAVATDRDSEGSETMRERLTALVPGWHLQYISPYDPDVEATVVEEERIHVREWAAPSQGNMIEGLQFDTWGSVTRGGARGFEHTGFIRREKGRLVVAKPQPKLVLLADNAKVEEVADAPYAQYAQAVRGIAIDEHEANLALARRCKDWGLTLEAMHLYMKVLIFDPAHEEALAFWGIEVKDGRFHPRKP